MTDDQLDDDAPSRTRRSHIDVDDDRDCPDGLRDMGYYRVTDDCAIDCPDCDSSMTVAQTLPQRPLDTDDPVNVYRCLNCYAMDFVADSDDFDLLSETVAIQRALALAVTDQAKRGGRDD